MCIGFTNYSFRCVCFWRKRATRERQRDGNRKTTERHQLDPTRAREQWAGAEDDRRPVTETPREGEDGAKGETATAVRAGDRKDKKREKEKKKEITGRTRQTEALCLLQPAVSCLLPITWK